MPVPLNINFNRQFAGFDQKGYFCVSNTYEQIITDYEK